MKVLTREQRIALKKIYDRDCGWWDKPDSYLKFRRTVEIPMAIDCIMVPWCGMYLGIETNGYTHS